MKINSKWVIAVTALLSTAAKAAPRAPNYYYYKLCVFSCVAKCGPNGTVATNYATPELLTERYDPYTNKQTNSITNK